MVSNKPPASCPVWHRWQSQSVKGEVGLEESSVCRCLAGQRNRYGAGAGGDSLQAQAGIHQPWDKLGCFHPLLQLSASVFPFLRQSEEHTHPPVRNIAGEDLHLKTNPTNCHYCPFQSWFVTQHGLRAIPADTCVLLGTSVHTAQQGLFLLFA